jgi:hypothetical protein
MLVGNKPCFPCSFCHHDCGSIAAMVPRLITLAHLAARATGRLRIIVSRAEPEVTVTAWVA